MLNYQRVVVLRTRSTAMGPDCPITEIATLLCRDHQLHSQMGFSVWTQHIHSSELVTFTVAGIIPTKWVFFVQIGTHLRRKKHKDFCCWGCHSMNWALWASVAVHQLWLISYGPYGPTDRRQRPKMPKIIIHEPMVFPHMARPFNGEPHVTGHLRNRFIGGTCHII